MVKKTFFIVLSACFIHLTSVLAGEFTANVSNKQVHLSESFWLSLTLKDASSKGTPDTSVLNEYFTINSQQYSNNATFFNGKASSSISWKLSLTPKKEGNIEIPSITIDTAEGPLTTQSIKLEVTKNSHPQPAIDSIGLKISAKISNPSPYKNEPIIYTASLTSKMPLYNLQTQKLQMQDAIVELIEEPRLEEKMIEGDLLNVVEFTYLITPLKADSLKIPSIVIHGALPQKRKGYFDDDLDPFAMVQGFDFLKPFTLMTEEIQLHVQPAIAGISPWLPGKALSLEEQWTNDQTLRVGEPFIRSIIIKAEGVKASQLPPLEDLQGHNSSFKIYNDKPTEQEHMLKGVLHSLRKEQYTLIPQQPGTQILPEVSITWWDTVNKEKRTSSIPARTVQILPLLETTASSPHANASSPTAEIAKETTSESIRSPFFLYVIIGILSFLLLTALAWGVSLHRKIASLTQETIQMPIKPQPAKLKKSAFRNITMVQKEKREKLPDLNPT
jgi:hypothetical protein